MRKSDDKERTYFRSDERFFRVDAQWFYTTRGGNEGPFPSQEAAARHLKAFIDLQSLKQKKGDEVKELRQRKPSGDPGIWNKYDS